MSPASAPALLRFALVLLTVLTLGSTAFACACCDGVTRIEPLGWSTRGDRLLVRTDDWSACEHRVYLSLVPVDGASATECVDLLSAPEQIVACDTIQPNWQAKPRASSLTHTFSTALRSVAPRWVRARVARTAGGLVAATLLTVELYTGGAWTEIARFSTHEYDFWPEDESPPTLHPLEVSLLPAPSSRTGRAAMVVRGYDDAPGMGQLGAHLAWVTLPAEFAYGAPTTTPGEHRVTALPSGTALEIASDAAPRASRANTAGFRAHRKGAYQAAATLFERAVRLQPGHLLARYNLTCAMARLGYVERAMDQLEEVFRVAGDRTEERRQQARVDPDLVVLRGVARFRELVEFAGPTAPAAPAR